MNWVKLVTEIKPRSFKNEQTRSILILVIRVVGVIPGYRLITSRPIMGGGQVVAIIAGGPTIGDCIALH